MYKGQNRDTTVDRGVLRYEDKRSSARTHGVHDTRIAPAVDPLLEVYVVSFFDPKRINPNTQGTLTDLI